MSIPDEQKRRDDLIELLCSLAESQDVFSNKKERRDIFLKLEKIYYIPDSFVNTQKIKTALCIVTKLSFFLRIYSNIIFYD